MRHIYDGSAPENQALVSALFWGLCLTCIACWANSFRDINGVRASFTTQFPQQFRFDKPHSTLKDLDATLSMTEKCLHSISHSMQSVPECKLCRLDSILQPPACVAQTYNDRETYISAIYLIAERFSRVLRAVVCRTHRQGRAPQTNCQKKLTFNYTIWLGRRVVPLVRAGDCQQAENSCNDSTKRLRISWGRFLQNMWQK